MIAIGLGSGRTGTASLARLFDSQEGAICFHELNPAGSVFQGNPQPQINTIREFQAILEGGDRRLLAIDYTRPQSIRTYEQLQKLPSVRMLGDIAFYYLRYVDDLLAICPDIRFVCIRRDKQETVDSWMEKTAIHRWRSLRMGDRIRSALTRIPYNTAYNHWQEHDGTRWELSPVWDKTFPKFEAASKREAVEKYWDYYYAEAERLAERLPANFRIFDISAMSNPEGQRDILSFVGFPEEQMVLRDKFHEHQSGRQHG